MAAHGPRSRDRRGAAGALPRRSSGPVARELPAVRMRVARAAGGASGLPLSALRRRSLRPAPQRPRLPERRPMAVIPGRPASEGDLPMTEVLTIAATPADASGAEERLFDIRSLAGYLGLDGSRLWLMRLLHASLRGPRSVRVAGRACWWRSDVDRWLQDHDVAEVLRRLGEDVIAGAGRLP